MTLKRVNYSYTLPEWASYEIDIPDDMDRDEEESFVIADLKDTYPDIGNVEIEKIEAVL